MSHNHQPNNYLRARAAAEAPSPYSKRTPERVLLCTGAVYAMVMAIFLALSYAGVIPSSESYVASSDAAGATSVSVGAASVLTRNASNTVFVGLYLVAAIAVAVVSVIVAWKAMNPGVRSAFTTGWMVFLLVFALITVDVVALIAFGFAFGLYMTRDRALIRAARAARR